MLNKDIVIAKAATIQRCLKRIESKTAFDPNSLEDIDVQDIFVLNLQRAIQSAVDLAAHLVSGQGWGVPGSMKDHFRILATQKVISESLALKMEKMAGFRNIAVHEYQTIDIKILKSILLDHLKDLEEYYLTILEYVH